MKIGFIIVITLALSGCLSGGGASPSTATPDPNSTGPTAAEVAAITPSQLSTYNGAQIVGLGTNFHFLSDPAIEALTQQNSQISSITAAQIILLTPAQVRLIGAAATGSGGVLGTSQIYLLNDAALTALFSDPAQVSLITAAEIPTLWDSAIADMGTNFHYLSNAALAALTQTGGAGHPTGQIATISAAQVALLTPAQVRLIGGNSTGSGGVAGTSLIHILNDGALTALFSDPAQVSAITSAETPTLWDNAIADMGTNFHYLSNAALAALTQTGGTGHPTGQIATISAAQVILLTPAQVRLIGGDAMGSGGVAGVAQLWILNIGTWTSLFSNATQVSAISTAEMPTFWDSEIIALGTNIQYLSNSTLAAMTDVVGAGHPNGQIQSLTAAQILVLSPSQISIIAGLYSNSGISKLNSGAFGSLNASQIAILTTTQKATLSAAQHTACGC